MSVRTKIILLVPLVTLVGLALPGLLFGFLLFPRPDLPVPVNEDACSRYNIHLDGTSIETIYLHPDTILADPDRFRETDPAYLLLGEHRTRLDDPFPAQKWLNQINRLADQPMTKREQQAPYRLYELIMANQNSFCREVASNVITYLPEDTDAEVIIYLTALEGSAAAFARDRRKICKLHGQKLRRRTCPGPFCSCQCTALN